MKQEPTDQVRNGRPDLGVQEPATWAEALRLIGSIVSQTRDSNAGDRRLRLVCGLLAAVSAAVLLFGGFALSQASAWSSRASELERECIALQRQLNSLESTVGTMVERQDALRLVVERHQLELSTQAQDTDQ